VDTRGLIVLNALSIGAFDGVWGSQGDTTISPELVIGRKKCVSG